MEFGDLNTVQGLKKLNDFLATRSYVEGATPSAADVAVFDKIAVNPDFINVVRWWNHLNSYKPEERKSFAAPAAGAAAPAKKEEDFELFGDDDAADAEAMKKQKEDAEKAKAKAKEGKPPGMSCIIFDVKPWDDETDMKELEKCIRSIEINGLEWQKSELVPVAFGVKKLSITGKMIDDLVSVDDIEEQIQAFDQYVQSVDIAAFVKL